jgi:peptidoglycan/xylan/chitin deacetylase (PgdA/CDA1 family)
MLMNLNQLYDKFTGPCIRQIVFNGAPENCLYLTFDDGPDPLCTPQVLSLLKKHNVKATFFVIGLKARQHPELTSQMLQHGHTIGDHSLDHNTKNYFKNEAELTKWLSSSAANLEELNLASIGFRSPVGIKTPALNKVLADLRQPLILWSVRFFDTNRGLSLEAVKEKISSLKSGDIILLHDTHPENRRHEFLTSLEHFIVQSQELGFSFRPLETKLVLNSFTEKYETR